MAAIFARGNPRKSRGSGGLYIALVAGSLHKHLRFFSRVCGVYVSDRRGSAGPPIRVKLRTARSARRAGGVHLALEPFRETFRRATKISHLLIKRGFSFCWLWLVSCGFRDGSRVKTRCRKGRVSGWQGSFSVRYEIRGGNNRRSINRGCKHRKQIRQSNNSHRKQKF